MSKRTTSSFNTGGLVGLTGLAGAVGLMVFGLVADGVTPGPVEQAVRVNIMASVQSFSSRFIAVVIPIF